MRDAVRTFDHIDDEFYQYGVDQSETNDALDPERVRRSPNSRDSEG